MSHDDFAFEPVKGLPERPPEGERILWQGRPDWWALTRESLNLKWVMAYFGVLATWRFVVFLDQGPVVTAFAAALPFVFLAAIVAALFMLFSYVQARATVYTITNRRVAMRIGAALTVTLNLPYTQIGNAGLALRRDGTGTIALELLGDTRLSYLVCWPHVRPWALRRPEPALRCIADAENVAAILAEAAEARILTPRVAPLGPQSSAAAVAAE